jgi:polysaccharide export outer membrane protein
MCRWILSAFILLMGMTAEMKASPQEAADKAANSGPSAQAAAPKPDTAAKSATDDPDFVIGPDDVLDISVWKEPEISRRVPVRPDGRISLPLLNDVQAASLTPMQLQAQLTERFRKFLTEPQVTVIVIAINSRRVYIMGEVNRPGPIPLLANMTVLQAITTAGGLGQFANGSKIRILRSENGKQVVYSFNYKEVLAGRNPEQNIVLKHGDSIVVP